MQNGTFGWASSLSSSLAAQKVPWTGVGVGYQASLTDLFLKKPFGSGISQLAAASSYLEKMSSDQHQNTQTSDGGGHSSAIVTISPTSLPHHLTNHKCSHDSKSKGFPCEICQEYTLCVPVSSKTSSTTTGPAASVSSFSDHHPSGDHHHHHNKSLHHHPQHSSTTTSPSPHQITIASHHIMPPPAASGLTLHSQPGPSSGVILPGHHHQSSTSSSATTSSSTTRRSSSTSSGRNKNAPVKQFICPVCHRSFTQKGNLKTHMMIHSGDKPYACHICGKAFTQKGNVDTHMKIHTGEKDYNCRSCGKGFTQRGNLKTHERSVHTKEKPYVCGMCGKSFSQKGNMQTHIRTHNKDDRFPCNLCGKTFSQKGNLKTHMQRHAGTLPPRKYGSRKKAASSSASRQYASGSSTADPHGSRGRGHHHLKSTDDESGSGDQSMERTNQSVVTAGQHHLLNPGVLDISSHQAVALKHIQSMPRETGGDAGQSAQRSPVAPIAVPFNSTRFYPPSSTISAPLAHTASWLAAASGASAAVASIQGSKGRVGPPYDILSSYAGFAGPAHHAANQHLSRFSILTGQPTSLHEQHQQDKHGREHSQQPDFSGQSSQQQPNPDFSQLLD